MKKTVIRESGDQSAGHQGTRASWEITQKRISGHRGTRMQDIRTSGEQKEKCLSADNRFIDDMGMRNIKDSENPEKPVAGFEKLWV